MAGDHPHVIPGKAGGALRLAAQPPARTTPLRQTKTASRIGLVPLLVGAQRDLRPADVGVLAPPRPLTAPNSDGWGAAVFSATALRRRWSPALG